MPNSVKTAEGKARQRARNNVGGPSNAGSSGVVKQFLAKAHRIEWDDVQDDMEHVTDIMGTISHTQVGNSRGMIVTITIPVEYAHEALSAHLASQMQMAYLRIYTAPLSIFDDEYDDDQGEEDGDSEES